jgi:hypothetical protein
MVTVAKVPAKNLHNLPGNVTDSQCVLFVRWLAGLFMVYTSTCRDLPSSGDGMARRDVNIAKVDSENLQIRLAVGCQLGNSIIKTSSRPFGATDSVAKRASTTAVLIG